MKRPIDTSTLGPMKGRCAHCGGMATHRWTLAPCALGKSLDGRLCGSCDVALNAFVLSFFGVPGRKKLIRQYRRKAS